jgi:hypothetical protein
VVGSEQSWILILDHHKCGRFRSGASSISTGRTQIGLQSNFDKRDSLKQEKAYKREVFCAF